MPVSAWPCLLLLAACGSPAKEDPAARAWAGNRETRCYTWAGGSQPLVLAGDTLASPGDSLLISLDLMDELANGTVQRAAHGTWAKWGSFTGSMEDSVITVLLTTAPESGRVLKQEVLFRKAGPDLRIGQGEHILVQGIWLFKDKSKAEFGPLVPAVACK